MTDSHTQFGKVAVLMGGRVYPADQLVRGYINEGED